MIQAAKDTIEDKIEPFYSEALSKKLGLEIWIIDFPHKRMKARDAVDYCEEAEYDICVAFSSGNYGRELNREALDSHVQPAIFMGKMEKAIEVINLGNGKYDIKIRLPKDSSGETKWFSEEQLERYWKRLVRNSLLSKVFSSNIREIGLDPDYETMIDFLEKSNLDYRNVKAVTNLCEWDNLDPYDRPEVYDVLRNNDTVILPNGSSELLLAFLKANRRLRFWQRARIVACTSPANIFSYSYVFDGILEQESEADKVDLLRPCIANWEARMSADRKTYFATIPDTYSLAGYGLHNGKVKSENPETNASTTSGICAGALWYALDNKENGEDLELPNTYRFEYSNPWKDKRGLNIWRKYPVYRECSFKPGEKVCIVNTGGK